MPAVDKGFFETSNTNGFCRVCLIVRPRPYEPYSSLIRSCTPASLHVLPIINMSLMRLRVCAPLPSLISPYPPLSYLVTKTVVSVGPHPEMFNIVGNDHGYTHRCEFSVLAHKHPFWANLVQKITILSLSWNLVPALNWICKIQWWCSLFPFLTENIF